LDALAFIWKQKGTVSESMPQAHTLVRAFNRVARIAAPTLLFKSEAIVHPDEVVRYIGAEECQLSYNPLLMALMWESLATREVRLLFQSLSHRFQIPAEASWVNYIRCHDDIGWTFDDTDAQQLGINGYDHRRFLNSFYTGRFPGSFARGLPFQENPATGDARISGSLASLAGLERALQMGDAAEIELAIRRILLLHSIILSIGGIPLIYLNDETGVLNDYSFREDPAKGHDSRWVHRPPTDWARNERRTDAQTVEGRIYSALGKLIHLRKTHLAFGGNDMQVINLGNGHVFGYVRANQGQRVLVLASFTEREQVISANELRLRGLGYAFTDLISEREIGLETDIVLEPYQVMWLVSR
jgi:amylosucrase